MSPGLRKCVPGLKTFSGFKTASHLNTAVSCLLMSDKTCRLFVYKSMSCKHNFLFLVHITFYGILQCLGEDGTWKQEMVSAEIDSGPVGTDISD